MIELSPSQQVIRSRSGNFFLTACPGSGKTRTVAARIEHLVSNDKRVAAISYTNVGVEEIRTTLLREAGIRLGSEHFTGTLHQFLFDYVLHPFGHLVMENEVRFQVTPKPPKSSPTLMVEPRVPVGPWDFSFDYKGQLVCLRPPKKYRLNPELVTERMDREVRKAKRKVLKRTGAISTDDALFIALCVLRNFPRLAGAVARRFDEIIVDEAQDTSVIQIECLKLLKSAALASIVLVGDVEQSIYSFQGASPSACMSFAREANLEVVPLSENHRSSQLICDVAARFRNNSEPDRAVGPFAECSLLPEVVRYAPSSAAMLPHLFMQRLKQLGLDASDSVMVARNSDGVVALNGPSGDAVSKRIRRLVQIASTYTVSGLPAEDLVYVESVVNDCLSDDDREAWREPSDVRRVVIQFVVDMQPVTGNLADWVRKVALGLTKASKKLTSHPLRSGAQVLQTKNAYSCIDVSDVFLGDGRLIARTVHSVKGQSRDAIMVVDGHEKRYAKPKQAQLWAARLSGPESVVDDEELRIMYVGLTRARRYCVVALPETVDDTTFTAFLEAGFVDAGNIVDWAR